MSWQPDEFRMPIIFCEGFRWDLNSPPNYSWYMDNILFHVSNKTVRFKQTANLPRPALDDKLCEDAIIWLTQKDIILVGQV